MVFLDCVKECAKNPEYVSNWERLRGVKIVPSMLDRMIDESAGYDHATSIAKLFIADVYETVWSRLHQETA